MRSSLKAKRSAEPHNSSKPVASFEIVDDPNATHLSELLIAFRKSVGVTQEQLADKTLLSIGTIRRYESGKYSGFKIKQLARIMRAYGYKIEVELTYPRGSERNNDGK